MEPTLTLLRNVQAGDQDSLLELERMFSGIIREEAKPYSLPQDEADQEARILLWQIAQKRESLFGRDFTRYFVKSLRRRFGAIVKKDRRSLYGDSEQMFSGESPSPENIFFNTPLPPFHANPDTFDPCFSEALQNLPKSRYKEVARLCGVKPQTIYAWVEGRCQPQFLEDIMVLAEALGVSPGFLLIRFRRKRFQEPNPSQGIFSFGCKNCHARNNQIGACGL